MNRVERRNSILKLRNRGYSLAEIGRLFNISRERARQITIKQDISINFSYSTLQISPFSIDRSSAKDSSGRDYVRELVRTRDSHTCQGCHKIWKNGNRRFDIHHLNGLCGTKSTGCDRVVDIPTLITLCHRCHYNHPEHSQYAKYSQE